MKDAFWSAQVLPTESQWSYNGTAMMHNQEANTWVMEAKEEMGYGDIVSTYTMHVGKVCEMTVSTCTMYVGKAWRHCVHLHHVCWQGT